MLIICLRHIIHAMLNSRTHGMDHRFWSRTLPNIAVCVVSVTATFMRVRDDKRHPLKRICYFWDMEILNIAGQVLGLIGSILLYIYGLPSKVKIETYYEQITDKNSEYNKKIYQRSKVGITLIVLGFFAQFVASIYRICWPKFLWCHLPDVFIVQITR